MGVFFAVACILLLAWRVLHEAEVLDDARVRLAELHKVEALHQMLHLLLLFLFVELHHRGEAMLILRLYSRLAVLNSFFFLGCKGAISISFRGRL